ncbi:MAG: FAD-dependent oxidoreductase, partial [Verrucomicrobiales bacterium]|nr:FAD-dependent oxidoreductase [Verrucomicrobiales bacterium]
MTGPGKSSRRRFLGALAGIGCVGGCGRRLPAFTGSLIGADMELGHRARDRALGASSRVVRTRAVIVGAGIAGLSAAYRLTRRGMGDFVVLELERDAGGNSRSGVNRVSAYPWGAHYVPLPGATAVEVSELFRDLGVIERFDDRGLPVYREEFLCHDPMERLFLHGRWQEGIVPHHGLSAGERGEIDRFLDFTDRLKGANGSDGLPLFAIPVDRSSRDADWRVLDGSTMAAWMDREGYRAPALRWYVNYCCRDEFGAGLDRVSAWAGLHYFAARSGVAANAASHAVVTWPEGNGWLVGRLRGAVGERLRTRCAVWKVEREGTGVRVEAWDGASGAGVTYVADAAILAVPGHMAARLESDSVGFARGPVSFPWVVANLTLDRLPVGRGAPLAWDNVIYDSPSLGYVVATHQGLAPYPKETVLTYYRPFDDTDAMTARMTASRRSYSEWCDIVLADLSSVHPELRSTLRHLDVMVWGHGMIAPVPGMLWGPARAQSRAQPPHDLVVVQPRTAREDVHGRVAVFGPRVNRHVGFRNHHH